MSWNTRFFMASKGGIQEMKKVTITSQFHTILMYCLCFLLIVGTFPIISVAAKTKKVLILGNNITQVEAPTISKM